MVERVSILYEIKHLEESFSNKGIDKYFKQLNGIAMLSPEELNYVNQIRNEKVQSSRIHGLYSIIDENSIVYKDKAIVISGRGNNEIRFGQIDEELCSCIQTALIFLVSISEDYIMMEESSLHASSSKVMYQYYHNMWSFAALQWIRDESLSRHQSYNMMKQKGQFSPIYGPGYYNMDLSQNKIFCDILMGETIGVCVNEQFQFQPEHTMCGIVLEYKAENRMTNQILNLCESCKATKKNCGFCFAKKNVI